MSHIVNSCANDIEHTEWSKLLNVQTLKKFLLASASLSSLIISADSTS